MNPNKHVILYHPRYDPPDSGSHPCAPLSLLYLADALGKAGFAWTIVDAQVEPDAIDRLRGLADDALAVGITSMTGYQIQGALEAAQAVRDVNPDVPLLWGGWHPSLDPELTAQDPLVDVVVRGPGEETLVELLQRRLDGHDWVGVAGTTICRDGEVVSAPDRPFNGLNPNRNLPFDKLHMDRYGGRRVAGDDFGANFSFAEGQPFPYTSSCGCPYRCRFCAASKVYKRKWHALPVDKTLDELEELHRRYGIEVVFFVDPEFFINADRAEGIMQGILDRGLNIIWKAQVRPEHIVRLGRARMELAYRSGCRQLEIGTESGSPSMLQMIQKDSDPAKAISSAAILREVGIIGQYNLIFGFPYETERHVAESLEFAAELKRVNPDCLLPMFYFTPHPGVPLMTEARECGYEPPRSLREWSRMRWSYSEPVMPWIRRPRRLKDRILRTIVFYLPLAFPGEVTRGTLKHVRSRMRRLPDASWMWPVHMLARLRVKLGYYGLPWEWRVFNWVRG
ncbi:MAG: B12-binding domain-containing radical SAM protein [Phycisphaerae bacterium]|nr:B12-binding domain-containing radical SAM protein [Phycisphaerae bacterium]